MCSQLLSVEESQNGVGGSREKVREEYVGAKKSDFCNYYGDRSAHDLLSTLSDLTWDELLLENLRRERLAMDVLDGVKLEKHEHGV